MDITISNLWIAYFVSLVLLSLIGAFIVKKSGSNAYSIAVLISAILSALLVYLLVYYNVDIEGLSAQDKSSLEALYLSALVIVALAFIWGIADLGMRSGKAIKKGFHTHTEVECSKDEEDCEVKSLEIHGTDEDGTYSESTFKCSDGECSPSHYYSKDAKDNTVEISYLA